MLPSCKVTDKKSLDDNQTILSVDASLFQKDGITITTVPCTLSDGTKTKCFQIVSNSTPTDHNMGSMVSYKYC